MNSKIILSGLMAVALAGTASAVIQEINWNSDNLNLAIPDHSSAGLAVSYSDPGGHYNGDNDAGIDGVTVRLNISGGGYNGDLYGYLVYAPASGATATEILLNRVGVGNQGVSSYGYGTSGFGSITLSDSGAANIHNVENPAGGTWRPDSTAALAGDPTTSPGTFSGMNVNGGTWTLFLSDLSAGDQSTLVSWGLTVSVVPEPVTWALLGFGGIVGGLILMRRRVEIGKAFGKVASWKNEV